MTNIDKDVFSKKLIYHGKKIVIIITNLFYLMVK